MNSPEEDFTAAAKWLAELSKEPRFTLEGSPGPLFTWGYSAGFQAAIRCLSDPAAVIERCREYNERQKVNTAQ